MKKVTFALLVATLPLLAGCWGKDKEEVKTETALPVETTSDESSMNNEEASTATESADEKE